MTAPRSGAVKHPPTNRTGEKVVRNRHTESAAQPTGLLSRNAPFHLIPKNLAAQSFSGALIYATYFPSPCLLARTQFLSRLLLIPKNLAAQSFSGALILQSGFWKRPPLGGRYPFAAFGAAVAPAAPASLPARLSRCAHSPPGS